MLANVMRPHVAAVLAAVFVSTRATAGPEVKSISPPDGRVFWRSIHASRSAGSYLMARLIRTHGIWPVLVNVHSNRAEMANVCAAASGLSNRRESGGASCIRWFFMESVPKK
jgi:hypothetical protein